MTSEERDLINSLMYDFSRGDRSKYEEFYKRFYEYYKLFIRAKVKNEHTANDLTQQLFLKIFKLDFDTISFDNLSAYFFTMAANLVRNYDALCRRKREEELEEALPFDQDFDSFVFKDLLSVLSSEEQALMELRYKHGYKLEEIAVLMEMSVSTIIRRTKEIKDKLRQTKKLWQLSVLLLILSASYSSGGVICR